MTSDNFEREKICYEQNFLQMRSLNEQMIKIPTIAVTITGGLWFVVGSTEDLEHGIKFLFLTLSTLINCGLAISCIRIRDVISSYLEKIERFSPDSYASGKPNNPAMGFLSNYSMIKIYTSLMVFTGFLSMFLAIEFYWPFDLITQNDCNMHDSIRVIVYVSFSIFIFYILNCNNEKSK